MKKILVPTDFSECARKSETLAMNIAQNSNAEIHFLHFMATPVDWANLPLEEEKLYPEIKTQIKEAKHELNKLKKRADELGVHSKVFLVYNKGKEELEKHLNEYQQDLVIIGSHGSKGFKDMIGSNAKKIIHQSEVPVIIVNDKFEQKEIKKIVFASNFDGDIQEPFLKVVDFANFMDAQLHLLHVNTPIHFFESDESESKMSWFFDKCQNAKCSMNIYNALNEERGIQKFAQSIDADITAMLTHGKKGIAKMFSPSVTESMIGSSNTAILSIKLD